MVREAVKGTLLEGTPVGHVDTWTEWVEERNEAVVAAVDGWGWMRMGIGELGLWGGGMSLSHYSLRLRHTACIPESDM